MNALIATIILAQFTAAAVDEHPPAASLISPTASARFALERVCGPAAANDEPIREGRSLVPMRREGGWEVLGIGHVFVRQEADNACYFRVGRGDPQGLRAMVLERLTAAGVNPRPLTERQMQGRAGLFRQEIYCLDFSGRSGSLVMSTALGRAGYRLQVTLIPRSRACDASPPTA